MNRYSKITTKHPREFLLLQGQGCFHKACRFCHYYDDVSENAFYINSEALANVTGEFGTLDIINSGSVFEIDAESMSLIREISHEKNIKTIWFETHYHYKDRLDEIRDFFQGIEIKFRTGVESFDHTFRISMNKGFPDVSPETIRRNFEGVCLLVCVKGQTKKGIVNDINIAENLFEYFSVNVFCPNSTDVELDPELYQWFKKVLYPEIKDLENCEILIDNTDLGVG